MDSLESQSGGDSEQIENQQSTEQTDSEMTGDSSPSASESQETDETEESERAEEGGSSGGISNDVEIKTADSLEQAIKQLASMDGYENVYVEIPKLDLKKVIVPNTQIHQNFRELWSEDTCAEVFVDVDNEYAKFKKSAQKEVNYLVKEFECRKSRLLCSLYY